MRRSITALVAVATLAGVTMAATQSARVTAPTPRVIVGVMDQPMNPYHSWFHADGALYNGTAPSSVTPALLAELGVDAAHQLRLTRSGDWAADHAADAELWERVNDQALYWFVGTNVLAISFDEADELNLLPDDDAESHGTGTSGAVLAANPDAVVIVMDPFTSVPGEKWMNEHADIDVLSASYGWIFGAPVPMHADASHDGVVTMGKLFVGAAGNQPSPDQQSQAGGAWWQIGVSGYHEASSEGQEPLSGLTPDFVGDFSQDLPRCGQCPDEVAPYSGTSFSTPRAAGTISRVILEARRHAGHLGGIVTDGVDQPVMVRGRGLEVTNWQVRRALEDAAWVPTTEDWNPGASYPINDLYPWPQVGWGVLTPDPSRNVISQALAHLGVGGEPTRFKPAQACDFMTANQDLRRAYWNSLPTSDSFLTGDDPYLAC